MTDWKYKRNAELRRAATGAKVSYRKFLYASPSPQNSKKKNILDTVVKIIFKKIYKKILGQNVWPVARSPTENRQEALKWSKIKIEKKNILEII